MIDEGPDDVSAAVVSVFEEEARRLRAMEADLVWGARGSVLPHGERSCWISLAHRGAEDPHLEMTATVSGTAGAYRFVADIGTIEGQIYADWHVEGGLDGPGVVRELRSFLKANAALIEEKAIGPAAG